MFVTPDSIVPDPYDPQDLNRYSYCRNNPLIYVDPTGHYKDGWGNTVDPKDTRKPDRPNTDGWGNVVDPKDKNRVPTDFGKEFEKLRNLQQIEEQRFIIQTIVGKKAFKVTIVERGTKKGPTFGAQIVIETDDGDVIVVDGSSWPNPNHKAPGIAPGSGKAKFSKTGLRGKAPGVRLEDGGKIPTVGPNPAQNNTLEADGVVVHTSFRTNQRGSANCPTIVKDQAPDVWNLLEKYEGKWGSWELIR